MNKQIPAYSYICTLEIDYIEMTENEVLIHTMTWIYLKNTEQPKVDIEEIRFYLYRVQEQAILIHTGRCQNNDYYCRF